MSPCTSSPLLAIDRNAATLLSHYREMGIESLLVGVHLDLTIHRSCTRSTRFANARATIAAVYVGPWLQGQSLPLSTDSAPPSNDWYVLADGDEFQLLPASAPTFLNAVEERGCDYVEGCLLDRLAADGGFPAIAPTDPSGVSFPRRHPDADHPRRQHPEDRRRQRLRPPLRRPALGVQRAAVQTVGLRAHPPFQVHSEIALRLKARIALYRS